MESAADVLFTYNKKDRQTSYEVCRSADGAGYELNRRFDDGHEEIETFASVELLNQRIDNIEEQLRSGGWSLAGGLRRA